MNDEGSEQGDTLEGNKHPLLASANIVETLSSEKVPGS